MWRQALATDEGVGLPKLRGRWCTTGPGRRRGGDLEELSLCNVGRALEFGNVLDAKPQGIHSPPRGLARSGFGLWRGGDHGW
jgi:hypothetical protein